MWLVAAWLAVSLASVASMDGVVGMSCTDARLRCAYRTGCGAALNNYMLLCADVQAKPSSTCPEPCQHALIALTSTEEGKDLMNCQCENSFCEETKQHIDVCRPQVLRGAANATASCRLSQLICVANAQCAKALEYYNRLCRAMFQGKKCSNKCLNSIEILKKQEQAAALTACRCDGSEEYDCRRMQDNLNRLCYHKHKKTHERGHGEGHNKKLHNEVVDIRNAADCVVILSSVVLSVSVLLHFSS